MSDPSCTTARARRTFQHLRDLVNRMERRTFLRSAGTLGALGTTVAQVRAEAQAGASSTPRLANASFEIELDPSTGSILALRHPRDDARMSWVSGPANAPWQPRSTQWGLGYADLGKTMLHRGRWETPVEFAVEPDRQRSRSVYRVGTLEVAVTRVLQDDALVERYRFTNRGDTALPMSGGKNALAIAAPFNDHYTTSADVMASRCHAHLWMGGTSAWVATLRMGGRAPHLGFVLNTGALTGYSVVGRDEITGSNTRGTFLLHPDIANLAPGDTRELSWTLFWHTGWDDFFTQCARRSDAFVRIDAPRHTVHPGETVQIALRGRSLDGARLTTGNGTVLPLTRAADGLRASFTADTIGERPLELTTPSGVRTRLVLNVVPPLDQLIAARVRFIATHQQVVTPGDPAQGAFVVYDNDTDAQVRRDKVAARDRNEGRERIGMGVLLARWLRTQAVKDPALLEALRRHVDFVSTRLQQPDGYVRDSVASASQRLYNWPWVAQLHLEYARLTGQDASWQAFVRTIDNYYQHGGDHFYAIGLPVYDGLTALKRAGRMADHDRLLALFERHARQIEATGTRYPTSEVNYEQSIVAPPAILLLELHRATGNPRWLAAARPHLALLELFNGRQPDHHLHDVAIRHWDGYWFGKRQLWGDTFPHYWSTLTAVAFHHFAQATGDAIYAARAEQIVRNNLSLFTADGRASAAFIYPASVNGIKAHAADPYANDQDWALVHALQLAN